MQYREVLPLYIIFGGGWFGKKAFNHLHNKGHILTIDNNPECLLDQCIESIGLPEFLNILSRHSNPSEFLEYAVQGDIEILISVLRHIVPIFLIPTAPIHIMMELIQKHIENMGYCCTIEKADDVFKDLKLPENLNLLMKKNTLYLSYNKFNQICPDSCPGPLDFCFHQNVKKPQSVTKFVESALIAQTIFIFESVQILEGLGGIKGDDIAESLTKIRSLLQNIEVGNVKNEIYIATTCNCHGVVDRMVINKESN